MCVCVCVCVCVFVCVCVCVCNVYMFLCVDIFWETWADTGVTTKVRHLVLVVPDKWGGGGGVCVSGGGGGSVCMCVYVCVYVCVCVYFWESWADTGATAKVRHYSQTSCCV